MTRIWRSWTLLKQLVVGVSVVVMLAMATIGAASVVTLRSSVLGIIDAQLAGAAQGCVSSVIKYRSTPGPDGQLPEPGAMKPLINLIGQAPGNVVVLIQGGRAVDSAHFGDGDAEQAPPDAVRTIAEMSWVDPQPRSVELPGLGWYRMVGRPGDGNEVLVTGVSRTPAWDAMIRETAVVSAMTLLALVVTALSTLAVVRFALRPLNRVSATAAEVAALPLDRDNHAITPRVPAGDTDPRTEVGLVGATLNKLDVKRIEYNYAYRNMYNAYYGYGTEQQSRLEGVKDGKTDDIGDQVLGSVRRLVDRLRPHRSKRS